MSVIYILVWSFVVIFGLTAVYGLVWAVRSGQMRNFAAGAASIFDEDEPVGQPTDRFPGEHAPRSSQDREVADDGPGH